MNITKLKKIPGYERYMIDSSGRVFSNVKNNFFEMKLSTLKSGYKYIRLYCINGKVKSFLVHRLVAGCFLGFAEGKEVNHKNKNKADNSIENLEWVTRSENAFHKYKTYQYPQGSKNCRSKLKEETVYKIKFYLNNGIRTCHISKKLKIHPSTINEIKHGRTWGHLRIDA